MLKVTLWCATFWYATAQVLFDSFARGVVLFILLGIWARFEYVRAQGTRVGAA